MKHKEVDYFEMFVQAAEITRRGAEALADMLRGKSGSLSAVAKIHAIENEGDKLYHEMIRQIERSFITPIDREDILSIFNDIEVTLDAVDEVAILIDMLGVTEIRPAAKAMVDLIAQSAAELVNATKEFRNYKKSKKLNDYFVKLNEIEEQGDKLYQQSIRELFAGGTDPLEVLKWKSILDRMEEVLDAAEHAADKMEIVIIKNS